MLAVVTSGGNVFSGHPAMAVQSDSLVPDDHKFHAEIGLAAAKLTRAEAEPLAQKLYPLFGDKLKDPDKGLTFQEVYDASRPSGSSTTTTARPWTRCAASSPRWASRCPSS